MFTRQSLVDLFSGYDLPVVNITAVAECRDFVTPAKALGLPPFALLLHGIARASLTVPAFRWRLLDGKPVEVRGLTVSYTVVGADGNLNFSTFRHDDDRAVFLERYLADREVARAATAEKLRLDPLEGRDYVFVTCMPWLRFTQIQHPLARRGDCSIPNVAVGRFGHEGGRVSFPFSVQAHHGLVDGFHVHQLIQAVEAGMDALVEELG